MSRMVRSVPLFMAAVYATLVSAATGSHAGSPAPAGSAVSWVTAPPFAGIRYTCGRSPPRRPWKAMVVPSGDQVGQVLSPVPSVTRRRPLPAADTT
jgi:hypothetical protein